MIFFRLKNFSPRWSFKLVQAPFSSNQSLSFGLLVFQCLKFNVKIISGHNYRPKFGQTADIPGGMKFDPFDMHANKL